MSQLHVALLERAAERLGGADALRAFLRVSEARLRVWMRQIAPPPDAVFLRLVDLLYTEQRWNRPGGADRTEGGIHLKVLRRAMMMAGGPEALAARLDTSPAELQLWLDGELVVPIPVLLRAIDLALGEGDS